ncbi:MAG: GTP-binding protein HflX [Oscillospiraceae bacterium]|jgi:GTP-binding protein HflX|nr:GTP-binding protein HflX [Oscillospiraceae bacterium]
MTEKTNELPRQRALLIALDTGEYDVEASLDELSELADTAGADTVGVLTQKREAPDAATCIGSGRLDEAALYVQNQQVDLVIFDCELSGSQLSNISDALDCRVIDRTMLILDIFAQRAHSAEGRLQVELAQQKYRLPRLMGQGKGLSRLGGGIGTRGPGETKLESDRRHIRRRIATLEKALEEVSQRRGLLRARRRKDEVISVAIVGYTNVGKSTLLNALTDAGVLAENMLFATLDPTSRALVLPDGRQVMLIDTVGLVRRLPHMLVDAFRSTLEEAAFADLILNICDISAPDASEQIAVTQSLLSEIGAEKIPVLNVLNKCDLIAQAPISLNDNTCLISAKTGFGLDVLLNRIGQLLTPSHTRLTLLLPYSEGGLLGEVRARGTVFSEQYENDGILLDAMVEIKSLYRFKGYVHKDDSI